MENLVTVLIYDNGFIRVLQSHSENLDEEEKYLIEMGIIGKNEKVQITLTVLEEG